MINAVIIDDEENSRTTLRCYINDYCPSVRILAEAHSVKSGIEIIKKHKPQLVFLDIILSNGTGFDILESLADIDFDIIFTTAYNEFAVKAFKFSAVDYLLKPIDVDELILAVNRVNKPQQKVTEKINLFRENLQNGKNAPLKIALSTQEDLQIVALEDILQCEAANTYTLFYLKDKTTILITKTLKEFEELLSPFDFIRVHKSHLVNVKQITKYVKADNYLVLNNHLKISVSLSKKEELLNLLKQISL